MAVEGCNVGLTWRWNHETLHPTKGNLNIPLDNTPRFFVHPKTVPRKFKPQPRNPRPEISNPKPQTPNPKLQTPKQVQEGDEIVEIDGNFLPILIAEGQLPPHPRSLTPNPAPPLPPNRTRENNPDTFLLSD